MERDQIYRILNEAYFSDDAHEQETSRKIAPLLDEAAVFVDAGASLGQYTRLACEHMRRGTIFAIEADPIRFEELERNCAKWANASGNEVKAIFGALTDTPGAITFHTTESNVSGGLFAHATDGAGQDVNEQGLEWKSVTVDGITLDDVCSGVVPDLIKMDIEGAELRALRGARRLLSEDSGHTRLLVEVHSWPDPAGQQNPAEVFRYMRKLGYHAHAVGGSHMFERGAKAALRELLDRGSRIARSLREAVALTRPTARTPGD